MATSGAKNGVCGRDNHDDDDDDDELDSGDDALLELLGLSSFKEVEVEVLDDGESEGNAKNMSGGAFGSPLPALSEDQIRTLAAPLREEYSAQSICTFPRECSIPAEHMRRLTEELVWGGNAVRADRTYETIKVWKEGVIQDRRTLTRLENFVDSHPGWSELCHGYIRRILSAAMGTEMVLYKEKLNLKPPGGGGFAPHLDTPSLKVSFGLEGPQTFCTVMVAIDDMTAQNGCLRVAKGPWSQNYCCKVIQPEEDGNPDAGGRAGAIPSEVANELRFEDVACKGGTVVAFSGFAPHRSAANTSPFHRRAVFLTYNPKSEGDFHKPYYEKMEKLRREWRNKIGFVSEDEKLEVSALDTIPKI